MAQRADIRLRLAGPLRIARSDGTDLTPRSAKARGMVVLLGATPELRRSRPWLQDKLWSDRGPEQGAASLRQVLVELRRGLGDCLTTDAGWVGLDPERVVVDLDPGPDGYGLAGEPPEFAEGLDVRDPEFEHWIRDQRLAYAERLARRPSRPVAPEVAAELPHTDRTTARRWGGKAVAALLVLLLAAGTATWLRQTSQVAVPARVPNAMPSVAVLPFSSLGGDAAQQALAEGVARDVITDLSKFGDLFVIAADTSFRFSDLTLPAASTAETRIAVRYALSGSIQWLGGQVRVNTNLIETETGRTVWAERFNRPTDDLMRLQNDIVRAVVDVIGPVSAAQGRLRKSELERIARSPTEDLQAYDHYVQGVLLFEQATAADNLLARESFMRASERDPGYAKAYAMATWTWLNEVWGGGTDDPQATLAQAEALAEQALDADPTEAYAWWALGAVRLFQRRHDDAIAAYQRALELNPNGQDLLIYYGWALTYAGEPDEGLAFMQRAIERNPYHPPWYLWDVAWAHFVARRYQDCADVLQRRGSPTVGTRELLGLCYAMLGRDADAAKEIAAVLAARPDFSVEGAAALEPFAREEDLQHYIGALRAARVPEHAGR